MKTRKLSFLDGIKSIMLNQRGSIGEEGSDDVSEVVEDSVTEDVEVAPEESEEVSEDVTEAVEEVQAETEAELEDEIKEAIEDGASDEEVKDMIRSYTLKVNGKDIVKELDLNDEDAVKRELQLGLAGRQSMQELQELKNTYQAEIRRLQEDPFKVLKELNPEFDALDLSAGYVKKILEEREMDPAQKEQLQREAEYKSVLEERDRLKQEAEDRTKAADRATMAAEIESDIMSVLEADGELVADKDTVALVVKELIWANKNNYEMSAKDVLPTVKDQLRNQIRNTHQRFKSTAILKDYMGDDLASKLREERVAQAKNQVKSVNAIKKDVAKKKATKAEDEEVFNLSDFISGR